MLQHSKKYRMLYRLELTIPLESETNIQECSYKLYELYAVHFKCHGCKSPWKQLGWRIYA